MMANNYFDQFDAPQQSGNYFDQFDAPKGQDAGPGVAFLAGTNNFLPFGQKIEANYGAGVASALTHLDPNAQNVSFQDYYNQIRANQDATEKANPLSTLAGDATALVGSIPIFNGVGSLLGKAANASPVTSAIANFLGPSQVAQDAGIGAKAGNFLANSFKSGISAAPLGALYGAGSAPDGQEIPGAIQGAEVGGALGAAVPTAGAALNSVARAISPSVDNTTALLAQRAQDLGIPLRVDQLVDSGPRTLFQKISQNLPFSGANDFAQGQNNAFNSAVAQTFGAQDLSPQGVKDAVTNMGQMFDNVLQNKTISPQFDDLKQLRNIVEDAKGNITQDYSNVVTNKAQNLAEQLFNKRITGTGTPAYSPQDISGEKLASMRSQLVKNLPNVAGDAKPYVGQMIDVIDNIAENNLPPDAIQQYQQARRFYRNYKTIDPLLEKSTDGTIPPTQLLNRVASSPYIDASQTPTGQDNLIDLARVGKQFLGKLGGSDTIDKGILTGGLISLPTLAVSNPAVGIPAAAGAVTGLGANRAYQSLYNTNPQVINSIVNRSLNGGVTSLPGVNPISLQQLQSQFLARKSQP